MATIPPTKHTFLYTTRLGALIEMIPLLARLVVVAAGVGTFWFFLNGYLVNADYASLGSQAMQQAHSKGGPRWNEVGRFEILYGVVWSTACLLFGVFPVLVGLLGFSAYLFGTGSASNGISLVVGAILLVGTAMSYGRLREESPFKATAHLFHYEPDRLDYAFTIEPGIPVTIPALMKLRPVDKVGRLALCTTLLCGVLSFALIGAII